MEASARELASLARALATRRRRRALGRPRPAEAPEKSPRRSREDVWQDDSPVPCCFHVPRGCRLWWIPPDGRRHRAASAAAPAVLLSTPPPSMDQGSPSPHHWSPNHPVQQENRAGIRLGFPNKDGGWQRATQGAASTSTTTSSSATVNTQHHQRPATPATRYSRGIHRELRAMPLHKATKQLLGPMPRSRISAGLHHCALVAPQIQ